MIGVREVAGSNPVVPTISIKNTAANFGSRFCIAEDTMVNSRDMKYHLSFLIVLMLIHLSCSLERSDQSRQEAAPQNVNGPTLSLGMSHELALEIIRECGGQDITSELAIVSLTGEGPLSGLVWHLEPYNSVISIGAQNGNLAGIDYWTIEDFSVSKIHRVESKRSLKSLTFEKQTRTVKIQVL